MKIALIAADNAQRARIFPPHLLDKLREFGELAVNAGDNSPEAVKPVIKDADVVITSWGSPRMTEEYLSLAPNAKLLLHAAGTVQPIVSEDVWKRKFRVICSSVAIGYGVAETALALAIALELSLAQTNDLIGRAGFTLNNSSKFDLIIRYFIEKEIFDIVKINMTLYEFDQSLLGS